MLLVDVLAGLLLTGAVLWCAYAAACRLLTDADAATRLTGAAIVLFWQLTVAFLLLSAVRLFVRPVALVGWPIVAFLAHRAARTRVDPMARLRSDIAAARAWWTALNSPFRILVTVGLVVVTVRLVHGLLAPCMTWDALTYHLYRPAVWVQSHGFVSTSGPDAAGYYSWFPIYGDAIWAWWLQAMRGDVAIAPVAAGMWLMVSLATYTCARAFGSSSLRGTAAAAAVAFTPAVINFSGAVYVDNLTLALYIAATAFLTRAAVSRRTEDGVFAAAALGILIGVKGGVVLPAYALGVAGALLLTRGARGRVAVLVAGVPAIVWTLMLWARTGSPVYPLTVRAGSRIILQGNPELEWLLHAGWMSDAWAADAAQRVFGRMFFPWERMNADFLNLGLGPLLVCPLVVPGLAAARRRKEVCAGVAFLSLGALLTIVSITGGANRALILWWWGLMGRLVTIAVAAVVLIAATWPSRVAVAALWVCAMAGLVAAWPRGLSAIDVSAATAAAPAVSLSIVATWIVGRVRPHLRAPLAWGAVILITATLIDVRDRFRYEFYEAAAAWKAYDVHPIDSRWTASWPIWQRLDGDAPLTLAVSAGWDGIGHNWYRYPLLGRRLQNQVIYVPISSDGSLVDYGRERPPETPISCDAWLARLLASPAQYLVMLPPMPPEGAWAEALPQIFEPEMSMQLLHTTLYRINRGAQLGSCGAAGMKNR